MKLTELDQRLIKRQLKLIGFKSLKDYYESERWRTKRNAFWFPSCRCSCCASRSSLQLHHVTYERLGFEKKSDCRWLCEDCHFEVHFLVAHKVETGVETTIKSETEEWKNPRVKKPRGEYGGGQLRPLERGGDKKAPLPVSVVPRPR